LGKVCALPSAILVSFWGFLARASLGVSEMTCGMSGNNSHAAADRSTAVVMAAVTLRSHVRQVRDNLQRLRAAHVDCSNCVQRTIDEAITHIKVGAVSQSHIES